MSLFDDPERNVELAEVCGQHFSRKSGLFLVEIHGQKLKTHRGAPLNIEQKIQQRVTVFAARKANHHAVAVVDHSEIGDGFAHPA